MHNDSHPILHTVRIADLRPTQMTVGLREVRRKRDSWRKLARHQERTFLGHHMVPVVLGPKDRLYVIDNHHLARALHDEGVETMLVQPVANLRSLGIDEFWHFMANRNWLHLYDPDGRLCSIKDLPRSLDKLQDDPYRSLAGDLRRGGGCAKDTTPYAEFLWADFLRRRIKAKLLDADYAAAVTKAMALAHDPLAAHLPGWCGPAE